MTLNTIRFRMLVVAVAGLVLGSPLALEAQQGPDFLFGNPRVTLGLRAGWSEARAGSQIFSFTEERLTLERGDFAGVNLGGQLSVRATDRVDLALDVGFTRSEARSEFRDWVDTNDLPIEQTTTFTRRPVTLSAKVFLVDRGRSVGRYAWIPTSMAPYVGAGGGLLWYKFRQDGDWVDEETLDIFTATFESYGQTPTGHVFGGLDFTVAPRVLVNLEGRYLWANAEMDRDFVDFDSIDLAGFQLTAGLGLRF